MTALWRCSAQLEQVLAFTPANAPKPSAAAALLQVARSAPCASNANECTLRLLYVYGEAFRMTNSHRQFSANLSPETRMLIEHHM